MRDRFGCTFPTVQEERKAHNNVQTTNSNGMHVSSNGYYGYQALPQNQEGGNENTEYMDVQISDSGIQFNNYIAPEDRLSGLQQANSNVMRGFENRKRRCYDDGPLSDFKKRREDDTIKHNSNEMKLTQVIHEKHTEDSLFEQLLRETHGCSIYHWTGDHNN
ncbi:hypothetical protein ILUMI_25839 [Ignelater luminosus]|uniref:Uncharacterized protein n=1 Tax=Ignelater luminosus TaxID=2038154 RepID=A0A8K0C7N9_IGNLU|nr:hypothetical protein ILUMI_25839 [Ignelater luminosus]